ncbi:hypothetical protein B2J93_8337 [Marssonina coronariae]|uniref:F-box domain-containing protein n=1 Tax=Diplocarpon coronariae TaxID=2795749 RepID=A0A218ZCB8_9HELO|nr:hypothetical protein B2J93_8337 [Marssonina coronariae]
MASLDILPTEILLKIAQFLGGAYLRGRVDRILLFREWYSVTQSVVWENTSLSMAKFEGLLTAPNYIQAFIRSRVKQLSISGSCSIPLESVQRTDDHHTIQSYSSNTLYKAKLRAQSNARSTKLCNAFALFSDSLSQMSKLKTFHLELFSGLAHYTETDNIWTPILRNLVASLPRTITNLTIDKFGQTSKYVAKENNPHAICAVLRQDLLPALQNLRLRSHCICPELFDINRIGIHSKLETMVLALNANDPLLEIVHHTRCCTEPQQPSQRLHLQVLRSARKAVPVCFPKLRTLRVLRFDLQELKFYSCDVVSGQKIGVPDGVKWDNLYRDPASEEPVEQLSDGEVHLGDGEIEDWDGEGAELGGVEMLPETIPSINIHDYA